MVLEYNELTERQIRIEQTEKKQKTNTSLQHLMYCRFDGTIPAVDTTRCVYSLLHVIHRIIKSISNHTNQVIVLLVF